MKKKLLLIFFLSMFLSLILFPLRGGSVAIYGISGFLLCSLVGFILIWIWTVFWLKRYEGKVDAKYLILAVFLGVSILDLPVRFISFSGALISFPNMIIWWLAILAGRLFLIFRKTQVQIIFTIIALSVGVWLSVPGYLLFSHKLHFGTFTGKTHEIMDLPIVFQNMEGDNFDIASFRGKYLVADFWNSYCGACLRDFSKVQNLYDDIKKHNNILLYSIHCRMEDRDESYNTGINILRHENYTFPCLSLDIKDTLLDYLKVNCYPTVMIFNPQGNVVFRGNIDYAIKVINKAKVNNID